MKKLLVLISVITLQGLIQSNVYGGEIVNAHGTLNVVLASDKGIVVASDSRITMTSSEGKRSFNNNVVKLLTINDVVVTVAGFYSGGVSYESNIYGSVPGIISKHAEWYKGPTLQYENIVKSIISSIEFNLSLFTSVLASTGNIADIGSYEIHLMFTKVENNQILFNKVILGCLPDKDGHISYSVRNIENLVSDNGFGYQFGGDPRIANEIMINPEKYVSKEYPIISEYANMKKNNTLRLLGTTQLSELSNALIAISSKYIDTIGGPVYIAEYKNGKFTTITPPGAQPLLPETPFEFNLITRYTGPGNGIAFGIQPNIINVIVDSKYTNGIVETGNNYYYGTVFNNCVIKLKNNIVFFSDNNVFKNCSLFIGNEVKLDKNIEMFIRSQKWTKIDQEKKPGPWLYNLPRVQ